MKVVVNRCFGLFSVSEEVYKELGKKWDGHGYFENEDFGIESNNYLEYRSAPELIKAIEKVGIEKSTGSLAALEIVDIPGGVEWYISDYDGSETVHETHKSW